MEKRLEKTCYHYYNVEYWHDTKWNFYTIVDTLNEANESANELLKANVKDTDIRVTRMTTYDVIDIANRRNYRPLRDEIDGIVQLLEEITETGYTPWTSPAPSSTELCVKNNVEKALYHLLNAVYNC